MAYGRRCASGRPYGAEDWVEVISHSLGIVRDRAVVVVRHAKRCSDIAPEALGR